QQIKNIAGRLAVAISTVARDKKLYQQSYYDSLTGLPNRQLLNNRLEQEITNSIRSDRTLAILFLDLDRFKKVNDTLGHTIGDELLIEVSYKLLKCVRETDTVARLGGDEFTIILSGPIETKYVSNIADKIINEISKPFYIKGTEIFIGTSIGISVFPNDGSNRVELLKNADTAMYRVKESGRGKHLFFEEQMNIDEMERNSLENDMRNALVRNEFKLLYQPLVDLKTNIIIGAEALIRWHHPRRGQVEPDKFIGLAEETGLMEKIGEWVLFTACTQFKEWQETGCILERIAVNVSSRQFLQNNFIAMLDSILENTNMPANKLEIEITESLLMDEQIDNDEILLKLSNKGIKLSIDDFGTGFSSLSYLKRFPLSTIKIDRSFMQDVPHNEDACSIVESIIKLGHTLKLEVVAEGIESQSQLNLLKENACNYGQGFYFSPPITANDFSDLIHKQNDTIKESV
ncbi:MAG: EAL domain-containing protein, partial [Gammaproteobacteria bacterium]|nr:EAL domain-containing protein [Gammaproteobacteria bacterium]